MTNNNIDPVTFLWLKVFWLIQSAFFPLWILFLNWERLYYYFYYVFLLPNFNLSKMERNVLLRILQYFFLNPAEISPALNTFLCKEVKNLVSFPAKVFWNFLNHFKPSEISKASLTRRIGQVLHGLSYCWIVADNWKYIKKTCDTPRVNSNFHFYLISVHIHFFTWASLNL